MKKILCPKCQGKLEEKDMIYKTIYVCSLCPNRYIKEEWDIKDGTLVRGNKWSVE